MCLWHESSCSQRGDTIGEVRAQFSLLRGSGAAEKALRGKASEGSQMQRQLTLGDHGGHRGTCFHIRVESRSLPEARPKVPYEPPSFAPLCASRAVVRIHPL